jgi:hypothetical protein
MSFSMDSIFTPHSPEPDSYGLAGQELPLTLVGAAISTLAELFFAILTWRTKATEP